MKNLPVRFVVALWSVLIARSGCAGHYQPAARSRAPAATAMSAGVRCPAADRQGLGEVPGDRRQRHRRSRADRSRRADVEGARACSRTSSRSCSATTCTDRSARRTTSRSSSARSRRCSTPRSSSIAALGNHDDPNQRFYKNFGMGGKRFYTYQKKDVKFFALDSNYMDKDQQRWLEEELKKSNEKWKIAYFHHPLYSSGAAHGSEVDLRAIIEPLFIKYNLQRRLCRPRALLRADQAAEGHPSLHRRRIRQAAHRRHRQELAIDRQGLRHRAELHAGRDRRRRAAVPDHLAPRHAHRLR